MAPRFVSNGTESFTAWREKIMVSAAASYSSAARQEPPRTPRKLKIRVKLPPLAACGVVQKPDGTCTVRPIRGSGKQMKLVRAAFLNYHLGLSETSSVSSETKPYTCSRDKIDVCDDRCTGFLEVKPPMTCRRPVAKPTNLVGGCSGFLEAKQEEAKPSSDTAFERKLEETKSKLQQQYRSIEDRRKRKRIEVINCVPASLPKDPKNTCRWGRR